MSEIKLNSAQQQAVNNIYGPLLVLAGPGTGKTQLLSSRVAAILEKTDVSARNILCLTFTEIGAQNMRERLRGLIGDDAYDVTINTYHSFGSDIIKQYSEYFQTIAVDRSDDIRMERPIDELSQIQIVESIIAKLPFDSPLLSARYYIKSVVSTISDLKQNLFSPDSLRKLAQSNLQQIEQAQRPIDDIVNSVGGISRKKTEKYAQYTQLLEALGSLKGDLTEQSAIDLTEAHKKADQIDSPTPLKEWKDDWLHKNNQDQFTFTDKFRTEKMIELAHVYEKYQQTLQKTASYDFDDMILRAIDGLKNNDELRYNLQERYQFILLDEFQDTNPSQFELVKRIADHPVHEGKPNIMAVGDDDQAIFAFQGAHVGNMKDFVDTFLDVEVINLTENYRSHPDILHVAHNIAGQIEDRLHTKFDNIDKLLVASSKNLPKSAQLARHEFGSEASEYSWIAEKIQKLVADGADPSNIAVLSPRHRILEGLVPFLHEKSVDVSYEKRENILETEIVQGLRLAAQLLQALASGNYALANQYFPLVLSLPYWQLQPIDIWNINWQYDKLRGENRKNWAELALKSKPLHNAVNFYLALAITVNTEPLEITLDKLSGTLKVQTGDSYITAPLKTYYFDTKKRSDDALKYYEAISHLSVIRANLRDHQASTNKQLVLEDFLSFFNMYEAAETPLINSHPVAQSSNSVNLMTVYKAKGLEFEHVFILQTHDDVWGSTSKGGSNKLSLPQNLQRIRYANSSDDERRRLFFVAITRAKHSLFVTSHTQKDNGKLTTPLKYLSESDGVSAHLPPHAQAIITESIDTAKLAKDIETLWQAGQVSLPADFKSLLSDRLSKYMMSPTHLNTFIDLERAGPEAFLVQTLLKFPQAPNASGEYGTAVHNTLEWYQNQLNASQNPTTKEVLARYDQELNHRYMTDDDRDHARAKGHASITKYLAARGEMFAWTAKSEVNFYSEGVILGDALLSGKIDRLEIDESNKTIRIADYKTGKPLTKWANDMKSLKYKQQLYFYKILIEGSSSWRGYKVEEARLEFVEPDKNATGEIQKPLVINFDPAEEKELKELIKSIWNLINTLDLPNTDAYSKDIKGSKIFIRDISRGTRI